MDKLIENIERIFSSCSMPLDLRPIDSYVLIDDSDIFDDKYLFDVKQLLNHRELILQLICELKISGRQIYLSQIRNSVNKFYHFDVMKLIALGYACGALKVEKDMDGQPVVSKCETLESIDSKSACEYPQGLIDSGYNKAINLFDDSYKNVEEIVLSLGYRLIVSGNKVTLHDNLNNYICDMEYKGNGLFVTPANFEKYLAIGLSRDDNHLVSFFFNDKNKKTIDLELLRNDMAVKVCDGKELFSFATSGYDFNVCYKRGDDSSSVAYSCLDGIVFKTSKLIENNCYWFSLVDDRARCCHFIGAGINNRTAMNKRYNRNVGFCFQIKDLCDHILDSLNERVSGVKKLAFNTGFASSYAVMPITDGDNSIIGTYNPIVYQKKRIDE